MGRIKTTCGRRVTTGSTTFLNLMDTPSSYSGHTNQFIMVNSDGDGVEFVDFSALPVANLNDNNVYSCPSTINLRDLVYVSGLNEVDKASKEDSNKLPILGMVRAKPTPTTCIVQTIGYMEGFSNLDVGKTYFLSSNGLITKIPTNTSGEVLYVVGVAKSNTRLELRLGDNYIKRV